MKRKYLSALLMGALTVTSVSTFTSCKDYDSDISNLQGQIDKAALSSTVEELKSQVEANKTSAAAAATSAEAAMQKAIAANDAVNGTVTSIENIQKDLDEIVDAINTNADAAANLIDSLANAGKTQDGRIADIETEIAKLKTKSQAAADSAASALAKNKQLSNELENAIKQWGQSKDGYYTAEKVDAKLDSLADAIQQASDDSIASLKKVVNGYKSGINALYTAVTSVSLVVDDQLGMNQANLAYSSNLKFMTGNVKNDLVFGAGEIDDTDAKNKYTATPQKTYKKGDFINFPTEILVRVNPVNAKITPSMIKLVDSKGNNLDDVLEVTDVKAYDGLITRSTTGTGLWVVSLQVKDGVKAENVAQKSGDNFICYAVAVNNTSAQAETAEDAANRYVVSEYKLAVKGTSEYTASSSLGGVTVAPESKSSDDGAWKQIDNLKPNGSHEDLLYVSNGENILINFPATSTAERYYVVLDKGHAGDSDASELNAWTHYDYSGTAYEKVVAVADGTSSVNVKINDQVGDQVQFRIFAVNYDGTLVEPYGRAFRVYVGNDATEASATGTLTATAADYMETGWVAISGALKDASNGYNSIVKKEGGHVTMNTTDGKVIDVHYALSTDGKTEASSSAKLSDCKYIKFWVNNTDQNTEWGDVYTTDKLTAGKALQLWADNTEATGTLHDDWSNKPYVNSITVKLTKKMPTAADAKSLVSLKWKDNQKVNGTYTAYLYPTGDAWTTAGVSTGYKNMNQAITMRSDSHISIEVENAQKETGADGKEHYTAVLSTTGDNAKLTVDKELIDGTTQHKSYIKYNYGPISSATEGKDYTVTMDEYNTVFACPLAKTAQTFAWAQIPATKTEAAKNVNVLTYDDPTTVNDVNLMDYIIASNIYDNSVFGGKLSSLYKGLGAAEGKYVLAGAKLISNESKNEDYFSAQIINGQIVFTKKSSTTNPSADVASTLVIELDDAFGHTMTYELPFTVKRVK